MSLEFVKGAKLSLIAGATAVLLTACASTPQECDPSQDQGFFGKMGCVVTGSYEERVEQKQKHVDELKAESERLNALAREVEGKRATLLGTYEQRTRMLDKTRSELYAVQASLAKKRALTSELQDKLDAAKAKVAAMSKPSAANQTLKKKQAEIEELKATLDELQNSL